VDQFNPLSEKLGAGQSGIRTRGRFVTRQGVRAGHVVAALLVGGPDNRVRGLRWSACCAERSWGSIGRPRPPGETLPTISRPQPRQRPAQHLRNRPTRPPTPTPAIERPFRDAPRRTNRACRGRSTSGRRGNGTRGRFVTRHAVRTGHVVATRYVGARTQPPNCHPDRYRSSPERY